ncbi:outer membrane beta-barrel protein [Pedobacter sp. NJ-S-72]
MGKIVSFFIALIAISFSCMAQTEKGKVLVGGYTYISSFRPTNNVTKYTTDVVISPTVGIFVAKNLVIGTGIIYSYRDYHSNYETNLGIRDYKYKTNGIGFAPFGRYYIDLTPQVKFFGHLNASVNWLKYKTTDLSGKEEEQNTKGKVYSAALAPGFAVFPSKRIGIELSITGFQFTKNDLEFTKNNSYHTESFNFGSDFFNPRLGIQFYL